jgi:hypothetical protein
MNLQPILNKTSPWAHMESELDMLGVARKLVKYVAYLSNRNNWEKEFKKILTSCLNSKGEVSGFIELYGLNLITYAFKKEYKKLVNPLRPRARTGAWPFSGVSSILNHFSMKI